MADRFSGAFHEGTRGRGLSQRGAAGRLACVTHPHLTVSPKGKSTMKIAKSYTLAEFLDWTRRKTYILLVLAAVPATLYQVFGLTWIGAPWSVAVLLGTATSFIVGFKNAQTYQRTVEAQQVWSSIVGTSRYWGLISRMFPTTGGSSPQLIHRHLAWLTVLRYQLRQGRVWESANSGANAEYRSKHFRVPEHETLLDTALQPLLSEAERLQVAATAHKGNLLLNLQSETLRELYTRQELAVLHHTELQKTLKEFLDQQSRVERIKNFPYPRQSRPSTRCSSGASPSCFRSVWCASSTA